MSLSSDLLGVSSRPSDARYAPYEQLAARVVATNDPEQVMQLVQHLVTVEGAEQYGRTYIVPDLLNQILLLLADPEQKNEDPMDVDDLTPLLRRMVELLRPRADDLPDALMHAVDLLAKCHQANGDYKSAAYTLSSFKFDEFKNKCSASVEYRFEWYVRTADFFLHIGEPGMASQQIKRAHALLPEVSRSSSQSSSLLVLRFKTCYARILDAERKFHEASLRYLELSQTAMASVSDADRAQSLEYAVSCAILAKAGAPRSRVLALLYSDERSQHLANFSMLEKMFLERIISNADVAAFEQLLQEHQKAATSSSRSVLQNAVVEHNLLAAAKIYHNIHFDQLGSLLGIDAQEAERLASSMIEQGRLNASIDQVESLLEIRAGGDALSEWDTGIGGVCSQVNRLVDDIVAKHPQYDTL